MMQQSFEYYTARSAADAADRKRADAGAVYMAGGTDVVPLMQYGVLHPTAVIHLGELAALRQIECGRDGGALAIGAAVTLHELVLYGKAHPALRGVGEAARAVASPQIRRVGTVAGNLLQQRRCYYFNQSADWRAGIEPCFQTGGGICHQAPASPVCRALYYSDLAPALLALGASVKTLGGGERPLHTVCGGPEHLGGDLVESVLVPRPGEVRFTAFAKVAVRGAIDFALANAAAAVRADGSVRVFMGAMTPQPVELPDTAAMLEALPAGAPLPEELYTNALREAKHLARPIREAGVSGAVKMGAVSAVSKVLRELDRFRRSLNG